MIYVGIDPGKSGAIAIIDRDEIHIQKNEATERDISEFLAKHAWAADSIAYIEDARCQPKNGSKANWSLGKSVGSLRMALIASGIPFEAVTASVWQRFWKLPTEKQAGSRTKKKNAHKARAQELWPQLKITHATADALLIAEYGRRVAVSAAENK